MSTSICVTTILLRQVPTSLAVSMVHVKDLPVLVRGCRLPAVLDETGRYCRAGLAVVLRHIIDRTCEADPRRKDAASLLGFKKTCLKACAEVRGNTQLLWYACSAIGKTTNDSVCV